MDERNHGARRFVHDSLDQPERVLGALAEPDKRDVGSLPGGQGSDFIDLDLARDHLMSKGCDYRRHEQEAFLPLVGDQDAQVLGLAVAHSPSELQALRSLLARLACLSRRFSKRADAGDQLPRTALSGSDAFVRTWADDGQSGGDGGDALLLRGRERDDRQGDERRRDDRGECPPCGRCTVVVHKP